MLKKNTCSTAWNCCWRTTPPASGERPGGGGGLPPLPLKLSGEQQKLLRDDPEQASDLVHGLVEDSLRPQAALRLLGALENRLGIELGLKAEELAKDDWAQVGEKLAQAVSAEFQQRRARLIGASGSAEGQLAQELAASLAKAEGAINEAHLLNGLMLMPGSRGTAFGKKPHKQRG